MDELIKEFDQAILHLSKVLEIWGNLNQTDDDKLTEHYNLDTSFDEIVYSIYCFVDDLKDMRGYPHNCEDD